MSSRGAAISIPLIDPHGLGERQLHDVLSRRIRREHAHDPILLPEHHRHIVLVTGPRFYPLVGGAALALLYNGQVLSVGGAQLANCSPKGCGSEPVASAELFTPQPYENDRTPDR